MPTGFKENSRNLNRIREPGMFSSPGWRLNRVEGTQDIRTNLPGCVSARSDNQLDDSPQWLRRTFTTEQLEEEVHIPSPLQAKPQSKRCHSNYTSSNHDASFSTKGRPKQNHCSAPHAHLSVRSKHTGDRQYGHGPSPQKSPGDKQLAVRRTKPNHLQPHKVPNKFTPINATWSTTYPERTMGECPSEVSPQTGLRLAKKLSRQAQELAGRHAKVEASESLVHTYQEEKRQKRSKSKRSKTLSTRNSKLGRANQKSTTLHGPPSAAPTAPSGIPNGLVGKTSPKKDDRSMVQDVGSTNSRQTSHLISLSKTTSLPLSNRDTAPARQNSHAYPPTNEDEQQALLRPRGAFLDLIPSPDKDGSVQSRSDDSSLRLSDGSAITPFHDFHTPPLGSQSDPVHSHSLFDRLSQLAPASNGDQPDSPQNKNNSDHQDRTDRQVSLALSNWHGSQCQNLIRPESDYSKSHSGGYVPSAQPAQQVMGEVELNAALDEAGSFLGTWSVGALGA